MRFTKSVGIVSLLVVLLVLGAAAFFSPKSALASNLEVYDLQGECNPVLTGVVGGMIGIPEGAQGLPYTVFVEWQSPDGEWHWVPGAGKEINLVGLINYEMDVSQTPSNAQWVRIRYKDVNWVYGDEISTLFRPCNFAPPAPTPNLHVTDLQAECTNSALHIVGGMIGVPSDAGGFPWTVFLEYQDPANAIPYAEDWHWVSGTGVKIGSEFRGQMVNFEFNDSTTPSGVTELRVRYKSGEAPPWIYGPEISRTFPPCGFTPPAPTPCNCPAPTQPPANPTNPPTQPPAPPTNPPAVPDVNQTVIVNSSSGSGSTSTSGGPSSGGGNPCCSSGCCDGADQNLEQHQDQDQTQSQTQNTGDVNVDVTVNGQPCGANCTAGNGDDDGNGSSAAGNGDDDDGFWDWDWWWLIGIVALIAIVAIVALAALGIARGRNDNDHDHDDDHGHDDHDEHDDRPGHHSA